MPRVIHFEIPSKDPDKAAEFYSNVFGWQIQKWDGPQEYWLVTTGPDDQPGINGALMRSGDIWIRPTYALDVDDVDTYIKKVIENGGTVVVPKGPVPGVGWIAYFNDLDGNLFAVMQADPNAA